ncbi:MAG: agmatine deiminase family protein [Muribaculaceae bacterium]|nr:agmatine deiminase family protein [Muribaculaceae bacterium]
MPAEWEPVEAVMTAWPHEDTDWSYMLEEVEECYTRLCQAISDETRLIVIGPDKAIARAKKSLSSIRSERVNFIRVATNDTWTRDYGAITVERPHGEGMQPIDFKFNGWGLKFAANKDNLVTTLLGGMFKLPPENRLSFVLEGGSIESDGAGTILTTAECLLSPNRNGGMNRSEIEAYIKESLRAKRILWLEHGALAGDDTDSHIDTLARLAPPGDVIFYTGCSDPEDEHYRVLRAMADELKEFRTADGRPYHLIELPLPDAIYDPEDGTRLPATYANFLIVNHTVLMPTYGQPLKDRQAIDTIAVAMPDYKVVGVDCRALIRQHGSLHCATMQFPINTLNI